MIRKASLKFFYEEYPNSILGSIIFNLFINDLFFFIKEPELPNFANDNSIYTGSKDLTEILEVLQYECEIAINWFNNMIVNPDEFQLTIISSKKDLSRAALNINGVELTMESSVKLLGIEIDNKRICKTHFQYLQKSQQSIKCNLQVANVYRS